MVSNDFAALVPFIELLEFDAKECGLQLVEATIQARFRVLSDQLPELGPHGPEPFLFSVPFEVK